MRREARDMFMHCTKLTHANPLSEVTAPCPTKEHLPDLS